MHSSQRLVWVQRTAQHGVGIRPWAARAALSEGGQHHEHRTDLVWPSGRRCCFIPPAITTDGGSSQKSRLAEVVRVVAQPRVGHCPKARLFLGDVLLTREPPFVMDSSVREADADGSEPLVKQSRNV